MPDSHLQTCKETLVTSTIRQAFWDRNPDAEGFARPDDAGFVPVWRGRTETARRRDGGGDCYPAGGTSILALRPIARKFS
jgi:hypothetical protein